MEKIGNKVEQENIDSLIEVKLDVVVIQTRLGKALGLINDKLNKTIQRMDNFENKNLGMQNIDSKNHEIEERVNHLYGMMDKFQQTITNSNRNTKAPKQKKPKVLPKFDQKYSLQILQQAQTLNLLTEKNEQKKNKNQDQKKEQRYANENIQEVNQYLNNIDYQSYQEMLSIFELKIREEIQCEILKVKGYIQNIVSNLPDSISKNIQQIGVNLKQSTRQVIEIKKQRQNVNGKQLNKIIKEGIERKKNNRNKQNNPSNAQEPTNKQNSNFITESENPHSIQNQHRSSFNFEQYINKIKEDIMKEFCESRQMQNMKIQENCKTNSVIADHVVALKTQMEQIKENYCQSKIYLNGLQQKTTGFQSQMFLIKESIKSLKEELTQVHKKLLKIQQFNLKYQQNLQNQTKEKSGKEEDNAVIQMMKASSASGFSNKRSSGRVNSSMNLESVEEIIRRLNAIIGSLVQRVTKIQQGQSKFRDSQSGFLPKIQKENTKTRNTSNTPSFDLLRNQVKSLNDQLLKTNQRLATTKNNLNQLYNAHSIIPTQIQDIYVKLTEYNTLQEDRLLELIKQLINRCLTDPFNHHFTNTLKRQINVKFLEIKHQYYGILKEIQNKVEDKSQKKQMQQLKEQLQQNILQVKSMVNKKSDAEDIKKGMKYLQNKMKDLHGFIKSQSINNQQKTQAKGFLTIKKN